MASEPGIDELLTATEDLLGAVRTVPLRLSTPRVDHARKLRREIADQLSDFVIPRLERLDAPMLVVVGGSTGAGKSTLVNSIVGRHVSDSGVLRPTTRTPVLVHHPDDADWFGSDRVLPDLKRTDEHVQEVYALRQISSPTVPAGIALLDAPDIDSVDTGNRELAEQLLAAADLWLFVTSAARYADQVPWDYLRRAAERSASVAVVLDRAPAEGVDDVRRHLARMMTARGLSDSPLFTVRESRVDGRGMLPFDEVGQIVLWLQDLAADLVGRRTIIAATLHGAIRHDVFTARDLADELDEQIEAADALTADIESVYRRACGEAVSSATDGTVLRGEVLARWQEMAVRGESAGNVEAVDSVLGSGLAFLLVERAERAAEEAVRAWASHRAGRALLDEHQDLGRAGAGFASEAERLSREWQQHVRDLLVECATEATSGVMTSARGVSTEGVALMVAVFAGFGAVAGAEPSIGTAFAAQRALQEHVGEDTARKLADRAAADLAARVETLFDAEAERFTRLVPEPRSVRSAQRDLRRLANRTDAVRLAADIRRGTEEGL
ncbi:hypothetical protein BHE97_03830 [Aeromicrobium sp. PE09-221]|uniref:dynamin family protein n=1 Tax=Aeromicrobium sp. PE09-221 TaxID=1898043 RepID=UPI000B3E7F18|nr:dynamin family protein [Aeromicrobium sp. PE09-221]OUZ11651.1 hypothetical protein BHE97_03830 [Aeromicrobium sp. PE09-221]